MRRLLVLILALTAWSGAGLSGAAWAAPPIWVIRDADSTIVIFGSVHLLPEGTPWRSPELDAAIAGADDLWFETDLDPVSDMQVGVLSRRMGMLPQNQTLSARLPPADRARLARLVERYGLYGPGFESMKPWLAELTISLAADIRLGARPADGVDQTLSIGTPLSVTRRRFETPEEQLRILAGATEAAQLASFSETLRQIEEDPEALLRIIELWLAGDVERLEAETLGELRVTSNEVYVRVIVDRNRRWAETIRQRLAGSGNTVMVVGVGHLLGEDGVPALLRARGVVVEGP